MEAEREKDKERDRGGKRNDVRDAKRESCDCGSLRRQRCRKAEQGRVPLETRFTDA